MKVEDNTRGKISTYGSNFLDEEAGKFIRKLIWWKITWFRFNLATKKVIHYVEKFLLVIIAVLINNSSIIISLA